MEIVYYIGVKLYGAGIHVMSLFGGKARQWVSGRKNWRKHLRSTLKPGEDRILFHCASLGEFEQGRPVLEALRANYPERKIVLTFFSPSGYEIRKNEPLADYVFYLPLDGPKNARDFISAIRPSMAFFVKYDFWHFFIREFKQQKIPLYFVSSIFRPSQIFFKPYGKFFDKMLRRVTHFFVQNQASLELLYKQGIPQVSVTGDTRFDRVYQNSIHARPLPEIEVFKDGKKLFVAGSTWHADEKLLAALYPTIGDEFRMVLVPHEIGETHVKTLVQKFGPKAIRYSQWDKKSGNHEVLVIDNVGMLSSVYRYADLAYVGGGFGKGIHNILEAVVFGIPVLFGPNYRKFREANDLIHWKGAFSVRNEKELIDKVAELTFDPTRLTRIREINNNYINNNKGSTELIISFLKINP